MIRAALFDFGGVVLSSPFQAFAHYEAAHGLPDGFIRRLNATNHQDNAWARLERSEVDEVLGLLAGEVRPAMVEAIRRCHERLKTACLTNNVVHEGRDASLHLSDLMADLFDVVIESSKTGVRKPDPQFYRLACEALGIDPEEAVFLDDLGINLKPARAMGMTTIKVDDPDDAIAELEQVVGFPLR